MSGDDGIRHPEPANEAGLRASRGGEGGLKASQETRQRIIDALCEHFAADAIDLNEFERRVERAHRAETVGELRSLLVDLPAPGTSLAREEAANSAPVRTPGGHRSLARPDLVRDNQFVIGFWGGPSRKGAWIPARHVWSLALMGGVELDLREARLGPGVTEISVLAMWGGVEIIVPPDMQVEFNGMGIMGAFECSEEARRVYDPDAPIVKINGLAIMGGAEVTVRHPGETAKDAKRRRKLERKEQRRRLRGD